MTHFENYLKQMQKSYEGASSIARFVPDPDVYQDAALIVLWQLIFDRLSRDSMEDSELNKLIVNVQRLIGSMNQHRKLQESSTQESDNNRGLTPETLKEIEEAMNLL